MSDKAFSGVTLDLDAFVAHDEKLMKHVDDWPVVVGWAYDQIDSVLAYFKQPLLDRAALKHPGEYFDSVLAAVKAAPATTPKAMVLKNLLVVLLTWVHDKLHPLHKLGA